ncbi:DUF6636 domain-containing protein [Angustibacter sp. McL0619]|uniref:DUF6636 domain-containing protein n=1 Tax=Angustibacter sp. McL0619 TaxID=3415676 RepID=UPI003CF019C8
MTLPHLPDVPRDRRRTATIIAVGALGGLCLLALVFGVKGLFAPADGQPSGGSSPAAAGTSSTTSAQPAPTGTDTGSQSPSPTSTPPQAAADVVQFASPSGNIRCAVSSAGARCDIARKDWSPGPKPAGCVADWGVGVFVDGSRAGLVCASDSVDGGKALKYGKTVTRGDFTCASSKDGISCRAADGHEFTLARASYKVS